MLQGTRERWDNFREATPACLADEEARKDAGKGRDKNDQPEDWSWSQDLHKQVVDGL